MTLNPYQGLKQVFTQLLALLVKVTMTLNPYQGLKPAGNSPGAYSLGVTMTLNPYQGLKLIMRIWSFSPHT